MTSSCFARLYLLSGQVTSKRGFRFFQKALLMDLPDYPIQHWRPQDSLQGGGITDAFIIFCLIFGFQRSERRGHDLKINPHFIFIFISPSTGGKWPLPPFARMCGYPCALRQYRRTRPPISTPSPTSANIFLRQSIEDLLKHMYIQFFRKSCSAIF